MLKKGELVRVRELGSGREWSVGQVLLVSPNGMSVGLGLDDGVWTQGGIILGALALIIDEERQEVLDLYGGKYELEVMKEDS